jgi:hypothetical protein
VAIIFTTRRQRDKPEWALHLYAAAGKLVRALVKVVAAPENPLAMRNVIQQPVVPADWPNNFSRFNFGPVAIAR